MVSFGDATQPGFRISSNLCPVACTESGSKGTRLPGVRDNLPAISQRLCVRVVPCPSGSVCGSKGTRLPSARAYLPRTPGAVPRPSGGVCGPRSLRTWGVEMLAGNVTYSCGPGRWAQRGEEGEEGNQGNPFCDFVDKTEPRLHGVTKISMLNASGAMLSCGSRRHKELPLFHKTLDHPPRPTPLGTLPRPPPDVCTALKEHSSPPWGPTLVTSSEDLDSDGDIHSFSADCMRAMGGCGG